MLAEDPAQPLATIMDDLREVVAATHHGSSLTRQLLAFSRRQTLQPEPLDLTEVVEATLPMLARLIGEDVQVTFVPGSDCRIHADRGQIEQVLLNLASNARDAMPDGGCVTIRCERVDNVPADLVVGAPPQRVGPWVRLSMRDTGTGIAASVRERLFEPFFTTKENGTGLGLATVYGVVQQSGGVVCVDSRLGEGTEFAIYLPPLTQVSPVPKRTTDAGKSPAVTPAGLVLLVEDDDTLRRVVARILERYGYRVAAVATPGAALRMVYEQNLCPDVAVTDMVMPEMSGRDMVLRLRERLPKVPALVMSGYSDNAQIEAGLAAQTFAFLAKPFTPEELLAAVQRILP